MPEIGEKREENGRQPLETRKDRALIPATEDLFTDAQSVSQLGEVGFPDIAKGLNHGLRESAAPCGPPDRILRLCLHPAATKAAHH